MHTTPTVRANASAAVAAAAAAGNSGGVGKQQLRLHAGGQTPRIDISRASSSSHHEDSRDSSPENVFEQVHNMQK